MRLLVIEDSPRLQRSLSKGLTHEGFAVDVAPDGRQGYEFAITYDYDAVILDLMLPEMSGLDVLKKLRGQGSSVHVLILSAKDQVQDRILGLELGADDYLVKPFDFFELLARVNALIRRKYGQKQPMVEVGPFKINTALHQVFSGKEEIPLTPKEYHLLEYLTVNRGQVINRDVLRDHLYDGFGDVNSNVIDVMICNLRKKLKEHGDSEMIQTKRGFGYLLP